MSRTALSYCSQSVKDRFLLAIFQHLNLVSCVSLSSVASRKRVQRYGLLWNWQAFTTFFFQENRIFLAFSILSDNGFLFTILFDVKFETSEQEMRQSQNVHFLYRTHVRTKKKPIKTDKNRWKHLFFCPTLTLPKGRNTIRNTGILTTQQYFLDTNYHQLFTNHQK